MTEDFFVAALRYHSAFHPDSVRFISALGRNYAPDSRLIHAYNLFFAPTAKDTLQEFSRFLPYFHMLSRKNQIAFKKSFIEALVSISYRSPKVVFQWASTNWKKIPSNLVLAIYNQIDLWKFFPMIHFSDFKCDQTNADDYLQSLIFSGRLLLADSVLTTAIRQHTSLLSIASLLMYKGDIQLAQKKYNDALGFYEHALMADSVRKDIGVLESLLVKTYSCLYLLYRSSGDSTLKGQSDRIYMRFIPTFAVKNIHSRILLLDGLGNELKSPYNDFVIGFVTCIRGALAANTDFAQIGYILSLSITKSGSSLPYATVNNYSKTFISMNMAIQTGSNYLEYIQPLVALFMEQYFDLDPKLFGEVGQDDRAVYPPSNIFNRTDLSLFQAKLVTLTIAWPETKSFPVTFRDRIYLGMTTDTGNVILGVVGGNIALKTDVAKNMTYKRFSVVNDLYFKPMLPEESKALESVAWAKLAANDYFSIEDFREALIRYVNYYPTQITAWFWLAQLEAAIGNYEKSSDIDRKLLLADPHWEDAIKLREFLDMAKQVVP